MAMEMRQNLQLSQQLVITPQLQQAIKILQLSQMELSEFAAEELHENPALDDDMDLSPERPGEGANADVEQLAHAERAGETETPLADLPPSERKEDGAIKEVDWEAYLENQNSGPTAHSFRHDGEDMPSIDATYTRGESLADHLLSQLRMVVGVTPAQLEIGEAIIGNLDGDGYFRDPPTTDLAAELGVTEDAIYDVLDLIQGFEPVGVGARSLGECLLLQAIRRGEDDDLVVKMIRSHLGNLEKKNYKAIAKDLAQPLDEVHEAAKVIMSFDPRPGRQFTTDDAHYVSPDVYVHKVGDKYFVVSNDDSVPRLKVSSYYLKAVRSAESKEYMEERLKSAMRLIRSIHERQRTIIRVTESILKFQREFFDKGVAYLKPLILRDVAEDIGKHESTVSRVTSNKYVHTPRGVFELKYFFSSGIARTSGEDVAAQAVKSKISELVSGEDPKRPHSDQKLVELLQKAGIDIARRTVAKYREALGILSSGKRKQTL